MMFETDFSDWIKAGKIASKVMKYGVSLIKPGVSCSSIVDKIEQKIFDLGGEIGFPAQISVNDVAAHFCPFKKNDYILKDGDVIKLDLGVSINGAIADTARTVALGNDYSDLLLSSKLALKNAMRIIKPGVKLSEIGKVISDTITSKGYQPVRNLSGHGLARFKIHTAPSIPNYDNSSDIVLHDNQIIAIEPFATNGFGMIKEEGLAGVYMLINFKPQRNHYARKLLNYIKSYNGLPFARRWLERIFTDIELNIGLSFLLKDHVIEQYKPLVEVEKGIVSQFEHTFIIKKDKVQVTTLIEDDDFFNN